MFGIFTRTSISALFLCFALLALSAEAAPGINPEIPFHGVLKDDLGDPLTGSYDMTFVIYDAPTGGTALWTGLYTVDVTEGTFKVMLGSGGSTFGALDFTDDTYYIGLTVEADAEMTPRQRIGASAYAFNADKLDGYDATDFLNLSASTSMATTSATTLFTLTQNGGGDILNLFSGASPVFTVNSTGMVGVGTTSPLASVHVESTTEQGVLINERGADLSAGGWIDGYPTLLTLQPKDATTYYQLGYKNQDSGSIANYQSLGNILNFDFFDATDTYTGYNALLPTGGYAFYNNLNGGSNYLGLYAYSGEKIAIGGESLETSFSSAASNTPLVVFDTGSRTVGIGTTTPSALLAISNSINTPANTRLFTIASTTGGTATSSLFAVLPDGSVHIGTTTSGGAELNLTFHQPSLNDFFIMNNSETSGAGSRIGIAADSAQLFMFASPSGGGTISEFQKDAGIYTGTGTEDLFIASRSATGTIKFYVGGSSAASRKMTLTASGSLGIGTTSPLAKLDVWGNFNVATSATSTFFVDTGSGRVGIGTTSPLVQLHVTSYAVFDDTLTVHRNQNLYSRNQIGLTRLDASGNRFSVGGINTGGTSSSNGPFPIYMVNLLNADGTTGRSYANYDLAVYPGGFVGVGLPGEANGLLPASNLHVSSSTGGVATIGRYDLTTSANDSIGKLQFWGNDSQLTTQKVFADIEAFSTSAVTTDSAAGYLVFRTTGTTIGGSPVERMRITDAGYVGIGTSSPGAKLHVSSNVNDFGAIIENDFSSGYAPGSPLLKTYSTKGMGIFSHNTTTGGTWFAGVPYIAVNAKWTVAYQAGASAAQDTAQTTYSLFTIQNNGNVGIGTTSPSALLSISNSIGTTAGTPLFTIASTTGGTSTSTLFTVLANGYVGIGTSSPVSALTVGSPSSALSSLNNLGSVINSQQFYPVSFIGEYRGTGSATGGSLIGLYQNTVGGVTVQNENRLGGIFFGGSSSEASLRNSAGIFAFASEDWIDSLGYGSYLSFATTPNGSTTRTERLRIDANGNVGIGTLVPTSKLHVEGSVSTGGVVGATVSNTHTAGYSSLAVGREATHSVYLDYFGPTYTDAVAGGQFDADYGSLAAGSGSDGLNIGAVGASGILKFFTGGANATNERMRITSTGNVGIGTSTPAYKLDVRGDLVGYSVDTPVHVTSDARYVGMFVDATLSDGTGQSNIFFGKNGTKSFQLGSDLNQNGTKDFFLWDSTNATTRLYVGATGNVGIGTTSPSALLSISNSAGTAANTPLFTIASTTGGTSTSTLFTVLSSGYIGTNPNPVAPIDFSVTNLPYTVPNQVLFADSVVEGRGLTDIASMATVTVSGGNLVAGGPTYRNANSRWEATEGDSMTLDFGSSRSIVGITFGGYYRNGCTVGSVLFEGSTDGISYSTMGAATSTCYQMALFAKGNYNGPTLGTYRYLRITVTDQGVSPQIAGLQVLSEEFSAHWGENVWGINNTLNDIYLRVKGGGSSAGLGRVGIGTSSPYSKLTVWNDNGAGTQVFELVNSASTTLMRTLDDGTTYFSGDIGIGTSSPARNLHIVGTSDPAGVLVDAYGIVAANYSARRARGTPTSPSAVQANDALLFIGATGYGTTAFNSGSQPVSISMRASQAWTDSANGTYITFETTPNGDVTPVSRMTIGNDGLVGIGTTTPTEELTVVGTIQATNLLGGAMNLTTDASGNIIRDPSDERLKENIEPLENSLEKLLELRGVSYEWKDEGRFGNQKEIGFIAQEVDLVLPEVVQKGGEYWSLNKANMLAVVVEAVKEMYAMMLDLFERDRAQEERIMELEARLRTLEESGSIVTPEEPQPEPGEPTPPVPEEETEPAPEEEIPPSEEEPTQEEEPQTVEEPTPTEESTPPEESEPAPAPEPSEPAT